MGKKIQNDKMQALAEDPAKLFIQKKNAENSTALFACTASRLWCRLPFRDCEAAGSFPHPD